MKIVLTSTGDDISSALDPSFGRAISFLLYDTEDETCQRIANARNPNAPQGAGIQAAQTIVRAGAQCLITGHCGPKAFRVLTAAGVKVFNTDAPTVAEALTRFRAGTLSEASAANIEGHWA